ncbi:MAG TPA: ThiF family adenylyltransferase [Aggregatilineales bacterium]|nr:ThiF family adenylyltransferase [Aggregatilineales bacterium]
MNVFDPHGRIDQITLVGLGGTGTQWARLLARIIYDMREKGMETPQLHFVDPDIVEPKNIGRQLFAVGDVGKSKAQVAATRLNFALGLDITYCDDTFDPKRDTRHGTLLCGAVDNHHARLDIASCVQEFLVWIDAGNHYDSGQVIIGNTGKVATLQQQWNRQEMLNNGKDEEWKYLPVATLLFPQLLEPDTEPAPAPDLSCADLVTRGEQHLLINDMVASVAAQYTYNLLHRIPITSFITYISMNPMGVKSIPITREDVMIYLPEEYEVDPCPAGH